MAIVWRRARARTPLHCTLRGCKAPCSPLEQRPAQKLPCAVGVCRSAAPALPVQVAHLGIPPAPETHAQPCSQPKCSASWSAIACACIDSAGCIPAGPIRRLHGDGRRPPARALHTPPPAPPAHQPVRLQSPNTGSSAATHKLPLLLLRATSSAGKSSGSCSHTAVGRGCAGAGAAKSSTAGRWVGWGEVGEVEPACLLRCFSYL